MGLNLKYGKGQTPLDEEEKDGLKIKSISTKGELDEFEQQNIEEAIFWMMNKNWGTDKILSENFICTLHKKMYGEVWNWAGKFRKSEKNIGIKSYLIPVELKTLLDDALFWINNKIYLSEEISIRFKHRLVSIHCFPNGNGRHSRLMADIMNEKIFKIPPFTWGAKYNLSQESEVRDNYIKSVKAADKGDYDLLIRFSKS